MVFGSRPSSEIPLGVGPAPADGRVAGSAGQRVSRSPDHRIAGSHRGHAVDELERIVALLRKAELVYDKLGDEERRTWLGEPLFRTAEDPGLHRGELKPSIRALGRTLEELDKVFIQAKSRTARATFGDIEVSQGVGEFARYQRRLKGVELVDGEVEDRVGAGGSRQRHAQVAAGDRDADRVERPGGTNYLVVVDRAGNIVERWTQWDSIFNKPHQIYISSYDPERHVWVVERGSSAGSSPWVL